MNKTALLLICLAACFLASCSAKGPAEEKVFEPEQVTAEAAAVSNEAVKVYNRTPERLVITLAGEPVALSGGFGRLVGVVSGRKMVALLDLGGRGLALEEGDMINDHRVGRIAGDHVVLEKRR